MKFKVKILDTLMWKCENTAQKKSRRNLDGTFLSDVLSDFFLDLIQFMDLSRSSQKADSILHSASHLGAHLVFIVVCLFVLLLSMLLVMLTLEEVD